MLSLLCLTTAVALPSRSCVAPPRPLPRRAAFALGAQTLTAALLARPGVARAEGQDPKDFARVGKGLKEVQFLLDNWSKETTNPTSGEMDPDRVRLYLGLRTTSSPLFQFEKLLKAAVNEIPDDRFEDWIAASEGYSSAVAKVNELAFTSSFGEYNPGGGRRRAWMSSSIVLSASRQFMTSPRASSRYLATWSLPPPGLYSPKLEVNASSFTFATADE